MKSKDVDNILDIPNMEYYLDEVFSLVVFDPEDNTLAYSFKKDRYFTVNVGIWVSDAPSLIEGKQKLSDLILMDNVYLFQLDINMEDKKWNSEIGFEENFILEEVSSHWFRPSIKNKEYE